MNSPAASRMLTFCAAIVCMAGCTAPPVATSGTDNPTVPVETLFTVDGCKVYRFRDGGRPHYFASCPGSISSTYTTSCGKSCTRTNYDEVQTVARHD